MGGREEQEVWPEGTLGVSPWVGEVLRNETRSTKDRSTWEKIQGHRPLGT